MDIKNDSWDLVIEPKRHLLQLNLKDVWKYRDLIILFVRRDFVAKYKQTILGPFWFVLNPLISSIIYYFVFSKIAGIPTEGIPGIIYPLTGLIVWQYFAVCVQGTSGTFVVNAPIFGKVYFPRLVAPISVVISSMVQLVVQMGLWICVAVFYWATDIIPFSITIYALLIPVAIGITALLALGFGLIISSLTTKYRDLSNFMSFGVQLWMYATPIIYPLSKVDGERYAFLVKYNPVTPLVETFKTGLLGTGVFDIGMLAYSFGFAMVLLIIGVLIFNKTEQNFMDTV